MGSQPSTYRRAPRCKHCKSVMVRGKRKGNTTRPSCENDDCVIYDTSLVRDILNFKIKNYPVSKQEQHSYIIEARKKLKRRQKASQTVDRLQ